MKDLGKINSKQLYSLWRNYSVGLIVLILTVFVSNVLPYYLAPVIALSFGTFLYFYIYNTKLNNDSSCLMPVISILYSIVGYAFVTIIINLLHIWGFLNFPKEFIFFTHPFIPSLILNPICLICGIIIISRKHKSKVCVECKMKQTFGRRGAAGVLNSEAHLQLNNYVIISAILTLIVWFYYNFHYIETNINGRDAYIFTWLTVIVLFLDEFYFIYRYFNLYLDLKEGDELITPEELSDMTAKTYVRYYVVSGNYMYLSKHQSDPNISGKEVIDTPFFTRQTMNGNLDGDVKQYIERMSGVRGGDLKFFYGRKSIYDNKHSLLRFFYFIDSEDGTLPELDREGEWMDFEKVKYLYSHKPKELAELAVYDITRLATIIITEKVFDENGNRKSKIKTYNPSFNLLDVRKSKIDFQDDKWIEVSLFNSDTPMFKFKKWWRKRLNSSKKRLR